MNGHIDAGRIFGKSISFPPRLDSDGRVAWSLGPQNVREAMQVILKTMFNERIMMPEFGCDLQNYLFEPNTVATRRLIEESVRQALGRWEPRIALMSIVVEEDPQSTEAAIITIQYRLVANQAQEH